jgi:hypothetical protein
MSDRRLLNPWKNLAIDLSLMAFEATIFLAKSSSPGN